jgi:hypothetical protein
MSKPVSSFKTALPVMFGYFPVAMRENRLLTTFVGIVLVAVARGDFGSSIESA